MDRDWANLPKHLLDSVAETLVLPSDYLQFSRVCKSWYSVAKDSNSKHARMTPPMLSIYAGKEDYWNLYNTATNKMLDLQVRVSNTRLCGSSKGWLIFVERNDVDKFFGVTLVNPFFRVKGREEKSNSRIHLPPLMPPGWGKWLRYYNAYVSKATISADPISNPEDCIVMVIHREQQQLAFIRLGKDTTWTYIDERDEIGQRCTMIEDAIKIGNTMIEDVINIGNAFYAVGYFDELISFDVTSQSYSNIKLVVPGKGCTGNVKRYIFEGEGKKLFMVQRHMAYENECHKRVTKKFRVFELNLHKGEWVERNSLGDNIALFIGDNSSISVLLPSNDSTCQSNCISFNHDGDYTTIYLPPHDFGIYNVVDQSFLPQTYPDYVEKNSSTRAGCQFGSF